MVANIMLKAIEIFFQNFKSTCKNLKPNLHNATAYCLDILPKLGSDILPSLIV